MRKMKDSGIEWIGFIPEGWDTMRIKYLADPSEDNSFTDGDWIESTDIANAGIRYLTTGNVGDGSFKEQGNGYISDETFRKLNCKYAYPNDLVISRLNSPYGRACILSDLYSEYVLAVDIVILRTKANKQFFTFVTQCSGYQRSVEDQAKGTTMKRISRTNLGNIVIPFPSILEQQKIAGFLYNQCSIIDSIVEKTKASIEEYKKLKHAMITHAVTKGVRKDRQMKNSQIEWLDEIPSDWGECRIKDVIIPQEKEVQENDEVITCFRDGEVTLRKKRREDGYTISFTEHGYHGVDVGDLVIHGMDAFAGAIGCSDSRGKITPVVHVCHTAGNNRYFMYYLRTMAYGNILMDLSNGVRIRSSDYRNFAKLGVFKICIPPINEQNEIVRYLDEKIIEVDDLINKKELFLYELESYKKSIIYEYVTGKKEVPST